MSNLIKFPGRSGPQSLPPHDELTALELEPCMAWASSTCSTSKAARKGCRGYCGYPKLDYATPGLSVGRLLRPARRRILKILLPPIGRHVEQRAGIRQRLGAARVGRIGVEDLVADAEESA